MVNRVQRSRKEFGLHVADRIRISYEGDAALMDAIAAHGDYIKQETLALELAQGDPGEGEGMFESEIDGKALRFRIEKDQKV
jgi:isoleucyl-tRNA synthetase